MKPYAELLEFNQPNPIRRIGYTRIRDSFTGLGETQTVLIDGRGLAPIHNPERIVEFAGRWDYGEKNAARLGQTVKVRRDTGLAAPNFPSEQVEVPIIQKYIDMGHESMLEMADATFFIECSRVVSHELVRHRIASYQQESQRFVKYDDEGTDVFLLPTELDGKEVWVEYGDDYAQTRDPSTGESAVDAVQDAYLQMLVLYKELRDNGVAPQIARYVLPNAMRTRLIMKTNLREWRHIVRLRLDKSAQPEMQELMQQIYDQLVDVFPNVMYGALEQGRGVR